MKADLQPGRQFSSNRPAHRNNTIGDDKNIHVSQETQSAKGCHGARAQRNALQTLYFLSGDNKTQVQHPRFSHFFNIAFFYSNAEKQRK